MPGGKIQLLAKGQENIYFNGNPQISFFKQVYKKHTNFALQSIRYNFIGAGAGELSLAAETQIDMNITRSGDLIKNMYLGFKLPKVTVTGTSLAAPAKFRWINDIGNYIIQDCKLSIGGNLINILYGEWMHIWNELSLTKEEQGALGSSTTFATGYNKMVGNYTGPIDSNTSYGPRATITSSGTTITSPEYNCYVPLYFWFHRNPGLAIPIISILYQTITLTLTLRSFNSIKMQNNATSPAITVVNMVNSRINIEPYIDIENVYLDAEERKFFENNELEYVIEQYQYQQVIGSNIATNNRLFFINPVKELFWVIQKDTDVDNLYDSLTTGNYNSSGVPDNKYNMTHQSHDKYQNYNEHYITSAYILFNRTSRIETFQNEYFNYVQPYEYHSSSPSLGIYTYSFSLHPEYTQPSGSCNFSRINEIYLGLNIPASFPVTGAENLVNGTYNTGISGSYQHNYELKLRVYATSYNILTVVNGMVDLAYI